MPCSAHMATKHGIPNPCSVQHPLFGYNFLAMYFILVVLWALQHRGERVCALLRNWFLVYIGGLCFGRYLLQRPSESFLLKSLALVSILDVTRQAFQQV